MRNVTQIRACHQTVITDDSSAVSLTVAYGLVFLIAMLGNTFVIYVTRKRLSRTNVPFNHFILNLAVCDFIYAFAALSISIPYLFVKNRWFPGPFGLFLAKFLTFSLGLTVSTSVFTLTTMALDRYLAIVQVMKQPLTTNTVLKAICLIWSVSGLLSATELYKTTTNSFTCNNKTIAHYFSKWSDNQQTSLALFKAEYTFKFSVLFAFPIVAMVILYASIVQYLWVLRVPGVRSFDDQRKIIHKRRKTILMLVTMTAVFAIGWFPVHVNHYLIFYDPAKYIRLPYFLPLVLFWLAHANCAINPCLYLIFNKEYRDEFQATVQRFLSCYARPRGANRVGVILMSLYRQPRHLDSSPTMRTHLNMLRKEGILAMESKL